MTKPNLDEIALRMQEQAEMLDNTAFTLRGEWVTVEVGLQRAKRNPMRDRVSSALIAAMHDCIGIVDNAYLRCTLVTRTAALEAALSATAEDPIADKTAAMQLIRTARYYAPMLDEIAAKRTDATEERTRIIRELNESADAVETGAREYVYTIFDNSEAARTWQENAQRLVNALLAAKSFLPKWAANVGMNSNAISVQPFIRTARACRGNESGESMLVEASKTYANKARQVAAIIA